MGGVVKSSETAIVQNGSSECVGRVASRRRMRVGTLLVLAGAMALGLHSTGVSVEGQSLEGLEDAVAYYHEFATSDLSHIHEATRRFESVTIKHSGEEPHPDSWLAAYWTAFAYTQLALFARDERSRYYVELADHYARLARAGKPDAGDALEADFYALEAMVAGFMGNAFPEDAEEHEATEQEAWEQARTLDPDNPMALMNQGLSLLPAEETRVRAYEILDRAIEQYEPRMGGVMPNWGREFIDVWMGSYPRPEAGGRR